MSAQLKESSAPLAEISHGPSPFEAFLDRNQKGLIGLAVVLALGAAVVVVYRGIQHSHEESAGAELVKAENAAGYETVIKDHPETAAAGSALILMANSQWTDGKKDEAVATLQKFVAEHPQHAALPSAKANLAAKLMNLGKSGDAAKLFEEIVTDPAAKFIAPFALVSLGDIAKASGDLTKAEESYNKVKSQFPDSNFTETANRRLAILKAKPPVEIEPPPAPPAPAAGDASAPAAPAMGDAITSPTPSIPGLSVTPVTDEEAPATETPAPQPGQ